ncbi:hypothetical protein AX15_006836 [Amanita polypyramis BW_CC]|nr:hypothetical protein AX15_006836 [Amanita polypyramis BW_CC]
MSAPYSFQSPYVPPQPHSTPVFASSPYVLNRPRAPRAPVINPYDKFTQHEFDRWIGGITGALRKALGHESDEPDHTTGEPESASAIFQNAGARRVYQDADDSEDANEYGSENDGVDDSLVDIRVRHVTRLDKGKGRDPMEGPGLSTFGKGDKDAPIEIDLDEGHILPQLDASTDEDALDDEEVAQHLSFIQASDEEEEEEEEEPDQWHLPQSSLRTRTGLGEGSEVEDKEEPDEAEYASSVEEEQEGSDNMIELLSSDEEQVLPQKVANGDEHEGEGDEGQGDGTNGEVGVGVSRRAVGYSHAILDDGEDLEGQSADEEQLEEDANEEGDEEEEETETGSDEAEEEEHDQPERDLSHSPQKEVITLDSDEEDQLDEEADIIQPPDQDTAFPPHSSDIRTHIEIRNPWLGPQTYAEDYYSGGPIASLPYVIPSVDHLGVNDDEGDFLTPGVVTPTESNERENSVNEELGEQALSVPRLQFIHGVATQSEMPLEAGFTSTENGPKAVQVHEFDMKQDGEKMDHTRREPHGSPPRSEVDQQSHSAEPADVEQVEDTERIKQQTHPRSTPSPVVEDYNEVPQQSQIKVEDREDTAGQAEDAFYKAYEEMDAEMKRERESEVEVSPAQSEQVDPSPVMYKNLSVTIEEVTDEEAADKESSEEEDLPSSPVVVPLGTSDLDIDVELMSEDEREVHSDDEFSRESEVDEFTIHAEDQLATDFEDSKETTENNETQPDQSPPITAPEEETSGYPTSEPVIHDNPGIIDFEESPDQPAGGSPIFPPSDFVNTAVEVEHEQQQLPTPPAEQDAFFHDSPVRYQSPDVELDATATERGLTLIAEDLGQASAALLAESSALDCEPYEGPMGTENAAVSMDATEQKTESAIIPGTAADVTDNTELAVQDVTEDLEATPDEQRGIVDEVTSNAEPTLAHDEHQSVGTFSKEASVVSLPVTDINDAPSPLSYSVEEIPEDEVTDDDADGEVDPDIGGNPNQDSSCELENLPGEIFNETWWASDVQNSRKPSFHTDATVRISSEDRHVTGENEGTEPVMNYTDQGADEDDIASSREASPDVLHQSTRSSSPFIDSKELLRRSPESGAPTSQENWSESEKDLYGASEANVESHSRESTAEEDARETPHVRGQALAPKEEASPTIPGLTLASSHQPTSPIPGLGARPSEETVLETGDGEIPGLTWSSRKLVNFPPPRSASYPQVTPTKSGLMHDWTSPSMACPVPRRATEPVLFSDPYPYSLSTPGLDNVKDDGEDTEEDLEEQEMSMSSSSTSTSVDKESEKEMGEILVKTAQDVVIIDQEKQNEKQMDGQLDHLHTNQELIQQVEIVPSPGDVNQEQSVQNESSDEQKPSVKITDGYGDDSHATPDAAKQAETVADAPISGDADQDRDADGDIDPDFVQIHENVIDANKKAGTLGLVEEPPKLAESASSLTAEPVEAPSDLEEKSSAEPSELVQELLTKPEELPSDVGGQAVPADKAHIQESQESDTKEAETVGVKEAEKKSEEPSEPPVAEEPKDVPPVEVVLADAAKVTVESETIHSQENTTRKVAQNGKRKRSLSPVSEKADMPRAPDDKALSGPRTKRPHTGRTMNGKGRESPPSDSSLDEYHTPGASSTDHMLRAGSAGAPSPKSLATMAIPASPPTQVGHFYPMLHNHRRGANKQPQQEKVSSQRPLQKTQSAPSVTRPSDKHAESSSTHVPFTSSRRAITSRATRSNCRYRKISVPKVEDGPRVCFLVPGCSLGDQEVIEDNEIEDLGEATYADSLRMVQDIESLDFDSYLIGVLRQLVGVDLLREQEVFYLPALGEEPLRKSQVRKTGLDKTTSSKKGSKSGNADSSSVLSTPRHSVASVKSPPSKSSITTVTSRLSRERDSNTPFSSFSTDSSSDERGETEDTDHKPLKPARSRPEKGKMSVGVTAERSTKSGKQQLKRSRRLTSDALAYNPVSESEGASSNDDKMPRIARRKPMARRGIKRTRPGRVFEDADGRDAKRLKRDR